MTLVSVKLGWTWSCIYKCRLSAKARLAHPRPVRAHFRNAGWPGCWQSYFRRCVLPTSFNTARVLAPNQLNHDNRKSTNSADTPTVRRGSDLTTNIAQEASRSPPLCFHDHSTDNRVQPVFRRLSRVLPLVESGSPRALSGLAGVPTHSIPRLRRHLVLRVDLGRRHSREPCDIPVLSRGLKPPPPHRRSYGAAESCAR